MKLTEFGYSIIEKFGSMKTTDLDELRHDCSVDYSKVRDGFWDTAKKELKKDVKLTDLNIKQKVVYYSEQWYVRLSLAFLFILITPVIQNYLNPEPEPDEDKMTL